MRTSCNRVQQADNIRYRKEGSFFSNTSSFLLCLPMAMLLTAAPVFTHATTSHGKSNGGVTSRDNSETLALFNGNRVISSLFTSLQDISSSIGRGKYPKMRGRGPINDSVAPDEDSVGSTWGSDVYQPTVRVSSTNSDTFQQGMVKTTAREKEFLRRLQTCRAEEDAVIRVDDNDCSVPSTPVIIKERNGDTVKFAVKQTFATQCDDPPVAHVDYIFTVFTDNTGNKYCSDIWNHDRINAGIPDILLCGIENTYEAQCNANGVAEIDIWVNDHHYYEGKSVGPPDNSFCPPNGFRTGCDPNAFCHFKYWVYCHPCTAAPTCAPTPLDGGGEQVRRVDNQSSCKVNAFPDPIRIVESDGDTVTFELSQVWSDRAECNSNALDHIDWMFVVFGNKFGSLECNQIETATCDDKYTFTASCTNDFAIVDLWVNDDFYLGPYPPEGPNDLYCPPTGFPDSCEPTAFCFFQYLLACEPCATLPPVEPPSAPPTCQVQTPAETVGPNIDLSCSSKSFTTKFDDIDNTGLPIKVLERTGTEVTFELNLDRTGYSCPGFDDFGNVIPWLAIDVGDGSTCIQGSSVPCGKSEYTVNCGNDKKTFVRLYVYHPDLFTNDGSVSVPGYCKDDPKVPFPSSSESADICFFEYELSCDPCTSVIYRQPPVDVTSEPTPSPSPLPSCSPTPAPQGPRECEDKIQGTLYRYTGPTTIPGPVTVTIKAKCEVSQTFSSISPGQTLEFSGQQGFSILCSGEELGSGTTVAIGSFLEEKHHSSCSVPYTAGEAAPLDSPKGAPSEYFEVVKFIDVNNGYAGPDPVPFGAQRLSGSGAEQFVVACSPITFPDSPGALCEAGIAATTWQYIGPTRPDIRQVTIEGGNGGSATYNFGEGGLEHGFIFCDPSQNGYSISTSDGLGSKTYIYINGGQLFEAIHTSCSAVYYANWYAPRDSNAPGSPEKGENSPYLLVLNYKDKDGSTAGTNPGQCPPGDGGQPSTGTSDTQTGSDQVISIQPNPGPLCESSIAATTWAYIGDPMPNARTVTVESGKGDIATYTLGAEGLQPGMILCDPMQDGYTITGEALGSKTYMYVDGVLKEVLHTSCSAVYYSEWYGPRDSEAPGSPEKGENSPYLYVINYRDKDGAVSGPNPGVCPPGVMDLSQLETQGTAGTRSGPGALCEASIAATTWEYIGDPMPNARTVTVESGKGDIATYTLGAEGLQPGMILCDSSYDGYSITSEALGSKTYMYVDGVLKEVLHTSCSAVYYSEWYGPRDSEAPGSPEKGEDSPYLYVINYRDKDGGVAGPNPGLCPPVSSNATVIGTRGGATEGTTSGTGGQSGPGAMCQDKVGSTTWQYIGESMPFAQTLTIVSDKGTAVRYFLYDGLEKGMILCDPAQNGYTISSDELGSKTSIYVDEMLLEIILTECNERYFAEWNAPRDSSAPDKPEKGAKSPYFYVLNFKDKNGAFGGTDPGMCPPGSYNASQVLTTKGGMDDLQELEKTSCVVRALPTLEKCKDLRKLDPISASYNGGAVTVRVQQVFNCDPNEELNHDKNLVDWIKTLIHSDCYTESFVICSDTVVYQPTLVNGKVIIDLYVNDGDDFLKSEQKYKYPSSCGYLKDATDKMCHYKYEIDCTRHTSTSGGRQLSSESAP